MARKNKKKVPVINRKVLIAVAIVGVLLLGVGIWLKIANKKPIEAELETSALSSVVEETETSSAAEESSVLESDVSKSESEIESLSEEEKKELAKNESEYAEKAVVQAATQVLELGGQWTLEDYKDISISFRNGEYIIEGVETENSKPEAIKTKYEVAKASFVTEKTDAEYGYEIDFANGDKVQILVYENNRYTLKPLKKGMFSDIKEDNIVFEKTAIIGVGNSPVEGGLTDEERNEIGVSYID